MHFHLIDTGLAALAALAVPAALLGALHSTAPRSLAPLEETVRIEGRSVDFPLAGEFLSAAMPVAAPAVRRHVPSFAIMRRQVGLADYMRCVADDACLPPDATPSAVDVPVTGISFLDAEAYARWYSAQTGETWRLPNALEAATAAAERFVGEPYSAQSDNPSNPAVRWLRVYREEAAAKRPADPFPKARGHYGANSLGFDDFGGNVWEWTSTCYVRATLVDGEVVSQTENCGVRVLEGRHRAYMSNFVREGKSGGCAVGTPPENLGLRLVREDGSPLAMVAAALDRATGLWQALQE